MPIQMRLRNAKNHAYQPKSGDGKSERLLIRKGDSAQDIAECENCKRPECVNCKRGKENRRK